MYSTSDEVASARYIVLVAIEGDQIFDWPYTVGNAATFLKKLAREIEAPILATMDYGIGQGRGSSRCRSLS